ncbi:MAG TPA: dual specificity protein phosphatase family protein [Polyangia bacterium]
MIAGGGSLRWLEPGVLGGGPHPDPFGDPAELERALAELARQKVGAIVSLTELPLDVEEGELGAMVYLHAPTPDGAAPDDLEAICQLVDATRMRGLGTFVHCQAGQGRTGTALAAWLVWSRGLSAREAIDEVRARYHPRAIETAEQVAALEAFARRHRLL